ncbi:hypothetical protein FCIRC_12608 [Fusarium circinatum]|uniref:Uncharacterized protein n=1 Tax=Fusarium circinatum TaxID=48490 RepID=A0A8H5SXX3_FUSCI|nr:hypothetical protein FCIRC_12608 [Fusarium circinatum]
MSSLPLPLPLPSITITSPDGRQELVAVFCRPAIDDSALVPMWQFLDDAEEKEEEETTATVAPSGAYSPPRLSDAELDNMSMDDMWNHVNAIQDEMTEVALQANEDRYYQSLPETVAA